MKKLATVLSWIGVIFCFMCLPTFGFNVCNIFFVLAGLLLIPEGRMCRLLKERLKVKAVFIYVAAAVFIVIGCLCAPNIAPENENTPAINTSASSVQTTKAATSAQTTALAVTTSVKVQTTASAASTAGTVQASTAQTTAAQTDTASTTPVQTTIQTTTAQTTVAQTTTPVASTYILNIDSKKIHYPTCASAKKIKESNRAEHIGDYSDLLTQGYTTCGNCFK